MESDEIWWNVIFADFHAVFKGFYKIPVPYYCDFSAAAYDNPYFL